MGAVGALLAKVPIWVWLALAALGIIGVQSLIIHHDSKSLALYKQATKDFTAAQNQNLQTIRELQGANASWAIKDAADLKLSKTYADAARDYAMNQQKQKTIVQTKLKVIYEKFPNVAAWASAAPPVSVAEQLRANAGTH